MSNTKEKILNAALDLFSRKGFSAVSIRDICAVVQIKESTVYYHVQNKEAILDELLKEFQARSEALIGRMQASFTTLSSGPQAGEKLFSKILSEYVDNYLADPFCNKVIRILFIDQLNNSKVHDLYTYWIFDKPLEINRYVIAAFQAAGIISCQNPELEAEAFYAPFFFCTARHLLSGELTQEKIDLFKKSIFNHMEKYTK